MVRKKTAITPVVVPRHSLGLTIAAATVFLTPMLTELFVYDRSAIMAGAFWRILTGHLVHFSREHLLGNCAALLLTELFLALAGATIPRRFWAITPPAVGFSLLLFQPDLPMYGGLSGIACGLIILLACHWLRGSSIEQGVALGLLVGIGTKILLESHTCQPLLAGDTAPFVPVPLAHIAGAACGAFVAVTGHGTGRKWLRHFRAATRQ